ncbi:hypothetical protein DFH09DRAFT_1188494 [Mycena vulgaris]|nr:hypothetical protein DFH09DRAFT_1188494 [Mycena vulgaris]
MSVCGRTATNSIIWDESEFYSGIWIELGMEIGSGSCCGMPAILSLVLDVVIVTFFVTLQTTNHHQSPVSWRPFTFRACAILPLYVKSSKLTAFFARIVKLCHRLRLPTPVAWLQNL